MPEPSRLGGLLGFNIQRMQAHSNPVHNKIRKNKARTREQAHAGPGDQQLAGSASPRALVLKEIYINLESEPERRSRRMQHCQSQFFSLMKRSFSACNKSSTKNKLAQQIQLQNSNFRQKIRRIQDRIAQVSREKQQVLLKIDSLKNNQASNMSIQIKKIDKQNPSMQSYQLDESSLPATPKKTSRMKLSEIRDRMSRLQLSSLTTLSKQNKRVRL